MKYLILSLTFLSFSSYAGVCCNPGGQQVPSMSLCAGSPNVDGSPCCNRSGNQPGGNSQQPITWSTGNSCGQSEPPSGENCCVNLPNQVQPTDCQALAAQLIAANSISYTDIIGRCNQAWSGQVCEWKCGVSNKLTSPKKINRKERRR